jgi:hypothetical protein
MKEYLKIVLNFFLPIRLIKKILENPVFCKHNITYYDMKLVVTDIDHHLYRKVNGYIFRGHLLHCKKCGIKKKKGTKVGEWGEWKSYDFEIPKSGIVEVEIIPFGSETKRQKRDRILRNLLD